MLDDDDVRQLVAALMAALCRAHTCSCYHPRSINHGGPAFCCDSRESKAGSHNQIFLVPFMVPIMVPIRTIEQKSTLLIQKRYVSENSKRLFHFNIPIIYSKFDTTF